MKELILACSLEEHSLSPQGKDGVGNGMVCGSGPEPRWGGASPQPPFSIPFNSVWLS